MRRVTISLLGLLLPGFCTAYADSIPVTPKMATALSKQAQRFTGKKCFGEQAAMVVPIAPATAEMNVQQISAMLSVSTSDVTVVKKELLWNPIEGLILRKHKSGSLEFSHVYYDNSNRRSLVVRHICAVK